MIKPVTFNAAQNFKANLYALEVKSRFIDQDNANGYYKGYGNELAATIIGTSGIRIGSGALLVQGRMLEIVSSETVSIAYEAGKVGYVICRIETSPATNNVNCSLVAKTGTNLSSISLTKEDTYAYESESTNKIYELPLYSFGMQNSAISNLVKLIGAVAEHQNIGAEINEIKERLDSLGFKQGSISLSLPDGWSVTENKLTRQGNYVIGSLSIQPPVLWKDTSFWGPYGNSTKIGIIPAEFRPKNNITICAQASLYFYILNGNAVSVPNNVNYDVWVTLLRSGEVYLNCQGETPLPYTSSIICQNFGFEGIDANAKTGTFEIQHGMGTNSYIFEIGMTWKDFVTSPYNDGSVSVEGDSVYFTNIHGKHIMDVGASSNKIVNDVTYYSSDY